MTETRVSLQRSISNNLPQIQELFDRYQTQAFVEHPPEFFCLELCGEAGELANLEKKRWRGEAIDPTHRSDEAADVFISLMNFCNAAGINLAEAVHSKLERIEPNKPLQ